jgi:excinuclease UvrABC nuclease subunit
VNTVTIPLNLPSVSLLERHNLPKCQSIYFVLEDGQVLYIGRTVNLNQRWALHHILPQLKMRKGEVRIAWLECSVAELLPEIETGLIEHFQPLLNVVKNPLRLKTADKDIISSVISKEMKERLKKYANSKGWSMSQAAGILIEEGLDRFEAESDRSESKEAK